MLCKLISCFIILSVCVSIGVERPYYAIRYYGALAGDPKGLSGQLRPCSPYPPNVRILSSDMHMADVRSQCREVLCPICRTLLLEPSETEIYDCPICSTCLQVKRTLSNSQKKALQCLSNAVNGSTLQKTTIQHEASSVNDSETQGQERKEDMPKDESIRNQEQNEPVLVGKDEDLQFQSHSPTSVANSSISNFPSGNFGGRNVASASQECDLAGEAEASRDLLMQQGSLEEKAGAHFPFQGETTGDGLVCDSVCADNTENKDDKEKVISCINCSMPSTSTGENILAGECVGVVETYQEEGNHSNDKSEQKFESEIIRDNDCELSFKYIASSSKSNAHLAEKKKTHRLAKLSSEASEDENVETTTTDSEFDFPAPSAESMHSAKLSETFFPKTPEGPHQLEWQDANCYNTISTFQESNSSTVSSVGVVSEVASNMVAQVEHGANDEIAENGLHRKSDLSKIIVSRRLDVTTETASISLHAQDFSQIGLAKPREKVAEEKCEKVCISGTISGKPDCDDKEGFLVDSLNNLKLNLHGELKDTPAESSRTGAEQIFELNPFSIVREHMQPSGADPSSSTFLRDKTMKTCRTVEEDAKSIKSVANLALKDFTTSSLQDNVVGTSEGMKRRERLSAGPIVAIRGDAENARSDLRKELDSSGVQLPNVVGKINLSQSGIKSKGHYQQEYLGKEVQFHNRVAANMTDPKWHHKWSYSSDAAQLLNSDEVGTSSGTYQHPGNIHDEDLYIPSARNLEGSFRAHEGHRQAAASMPAGRSLQLQSPQADQRLVGHPIQTMNGPSFYPARSESFESNIYFDGSKSFANMVCSYQAPSYPLMLPMAMHGHACSCHGCHPVGPVCMPYVCGQHSFAPQLHMQTCSLCVRTTGHYQGHTDLGNFYQGFRVQAPCMPCHSPACFPRQIAHMHDPPVAAAKPPLSSVGRKPKHYPPLPQGRLAPYVICTGCNNILEVPVCFPVSHQAQKLRCGGCGKVSKFSVPKNIKKPGVGLQSSAVGSTRKSLANSLPSFEFMVRNRELPVSDVGQSTESSYGKSLQNQWGSISSRHDTGSGHHSLQSELTFKVKPNEDEPNSKLPSGITNQSSQDDFFFRSLSRKSEFDSSRSLFRGFKTMSARLGVSNVYNDGLSESDIVPLQCAIDEKEEGLDFGAPRPSDGESLDQRSPESRMRSPENFESLDQPRHRRFFGDEETYRTTEIQEDFGSEQNSIALAHERSSTSLITLLNQESTKFEINLERRVLYEEETSSSWSPVLKSPAHDHTNQSSTSSEREMGRAGNLRAPHFVKKGRQYIAAMLTRSLKHRVNN
ncbi:hypothetical protein GOP47_0013471 [Adiantum capillus-veneris]|uniref:Probable zinc-ribbon domain-containing protein n=1 Tax=Adiantum capillus-veneris TaxID=13818 RepID=A0A9D4UNK9_ADICA|nr:hypothetical protein GOP47_0013471 [Adiantum capillus-veneris]